MRVTVRFLRLICELIWATSSEALGLANCLHDGTVKFCEQQHEGGLPNIARQSWKWAKSSRCQGSFCGSQQAFDDEPAIPEVCVHEQLHVLWKVVRDVSHAYENFLKTHRSKMKSWHVSQKCNGDAHCASSSTAAYRNLCSPRWGRSSVTSMVGAA